MKIPLLTKTIGLLMANKIAVAAVGVGIVIAAVPSVMYFKEKQANQERVKSNDSSYRAEATNTVAKEQTNDIRQADQNTTGGETVNREVNPQQANNTGVTTPTATNNSVSTQNNGGSSTVPQATTPAPTPSSEPYVPPVDWWDIIVASYSPTTCGETDRNMCPLGQRLEVTTKFYERTTGRQITATGCTAVGTISSGPSYLTSVAARFPADVYMPDNKTCVASFTPPDYGNYGIWVTVTTDESTSHPTLSNNTKYFYLTNR